MGNLTVLAMQEPVHVDARRIGEIVDELGERAAHNIICVALEQLAQAQQDIIFLCGHYEGFDQRILDQADLKISIGDYVLTGGEMPALVMLDTLIRFIPGVLGKSESAMEESFSNNLLEYPQYTRPIEYQGKTVPDILLSGDHAKIKQWRLKEAIRTTYLLRPDLLAKANLSKGEGKLFLEVVAETKDKTNE